MKSAKEDLATDDTDKIKAATEKLSNEAQGVFAKIYQQAAQQQQPGDGSNGGAGSDDGGEFHQN